MQEVFKNVNLTLLLLTHSQRKSLLLADEKILTWKVIYTAL